MKGGKQKFKKKMKEEKFIRSDGTEGISYSLEAGDEVISQFPEVGSKDRDVNVKGKPTIITNRYLGVLWNNKEITIKITPTQAQQLAKTLDLTNKKIVAHSYTNKFGEFVGVKVIQNQSQPVATVPQQ